MTQRDEGSCDRASGFLLDVGRADSASSGSNSGVLHLHVGSVGLRLRGSSDFFALVTGEPSTLTSATEALTPSCDGCLFIPCHCHRW